MINIWKENQTVASRSKPVTNSVWNTHDGGSINV